LIRFALLGRKLENWILLLVVMRVEDQCLMAPQVQMQALHAVKLYCSEQRHKIQPLPIRHYIYHEATSQEP